MSSLIKSFGFDVTITMASLISNGWTGQNNMLSAVGALYGIGSGMKDTLKLVSGVRTNPGFFLWKLSKRKREIRNENEFEEALKNVLSNCQK